MLNASSQYLYTYTNCTHFTGGAFTFLISNPTFPAAHLSVNSKFQKLGVIFEIR